MIFEVKSISKKYGNKEVLNNVNFSIGKQEIVGLIGPNGSGKTTLLNIITGMVRPTGGAYQTFDRLNISMSISRKGFFNDMTVFENIVMYCKLWNVPEEQIREIMNYFLIDFGDVRFGKLSAGMKQRVSIMLPFVKANDLVILDEPTNHLDIDSILLLRKIITDRKKENTSFIITSHIFSDLEKICDRILFLKNGNVLESFETNKLIEKFGNLEEAYVNIFQNNIE